VTNVLAQNQRDIGIPEERIRVIPNGINKSEFIDKHLPNPLKIDVSDKIVVGFVGFCRDWHGLDKIVQLLAQPGNENLFFLLVGDGPAVAGIQKIAKESGIEERLYVTGLVKREDMPAWLGPIDIALQPAVVDYASPLKMLEYMATGKAIVAPRQANIGELLTDRVNALLFDPNDQQTFVDACDKFIHDKTLREKLAAAAKETIYTRDLTWDGNAKVIVDLAQKCLIE
jgi:glycosyltransferase involved in cell wall biosynthesis